MLPSLISVYGKGFIFYSIKYIMYFIVKYKPIVKKPDFTLAQ